MVDAYPALKLIYNRLASLLQEPQFILGLIVFLGLALQKKPFSEIIAGIAIPMVANTMGGFIQAFGGNDFGFWVIITKLIGSLL